MHKAATTRWGLLLLALGLVACSAGTGVKGPEPSYSESFRNLLQQQPDLADALERIDRGDCAQALPLLTVYAGQDNRTEMLDYLLGRAYLCTGDFRKGGHHLTQAWIHGPDLRPEIRGAARLGATQLADRYEAAGGLPFALLQAGTQLYAFGTLEWYRKPAVALVADYAQRLESRGSYGRALKGIAVMKRIGAHPPETFLLEARLLIRLGEEEKLHSLVEEGVPELGEQAPELLYQAALAAEEAFRQDFAAWLLEGAASRGVARPELPFDLTRVFLKAELFDKARDAWEAYLAAADGTERRQRRLAVATLLEKYGRDADSFAVLEAGRSAHPGDFALTRAVASLQEKLPDQVDVAALFKAYLEHEQYSRVAVDTVGNQCREWRLSTLCPPLLNHSQARRNAPAIVAFHKAALAWQEGKTRAAEKGFDRAVKEAEDRPAMLDRIATLLLQNGEAKAARDYFVKALKRTPDAVTVLLKLATLEEEQAAGDGIARIRAHEKRNELAAPALGELAAWCEASGYRTDAVTFARKGAAEAIGADVGPAQVVLGRLLLRQVGQLDSALAALAAGMAANPGNQTVSDVFALVQDHSQPRLACFVLEQARVRQQAGTLTPDQLRCGAAASLRCGDVDATLLESYVMGAEEPAAALLFLLQRAHRADARTALVAIAEAKAPETWAQPELMTRLIILFAAQGLPDKALEYARRYGALAGVDNRKLVELGRKALLQGAPGAARELLALAWDRTRPDDALRLDFGMTLAALLFADGEREEKGMQVVAELAASRGNGEIPVAAASLLVDAGKPALAEEVCKEALRNPDDKGPRPGLRIDDRGAAEAPLSKGDILRLLAQEKFDHDPEVSRRMLVGLLAYAWRQQGKDWGSFLDEVLPLVRPWHGEHLVADLLNRLGIYQLAGDLYDDSFRDSPASFDLFKAAVDALVYQDYREGRDHGHSLDEVEAAARRFIKSREADPDAYKLAADYLEGKGFYALAGYLLEELSKATTLDAPVAIALARTQVSLGKYSEAAASFKVAAQLGACSQKIVEPMVQEVRRVARLDIAADVLSECANKYPKDGNLHLLAAKVLLEMGEERGGEVLSRLQKAVVQDKSLQEEAARLLINNNRAEDAWPFVELMVRSKTPGVPLKGLEMGFEIASARGDVERMTRLGSQATRQHRKDRQLAAEIAGVYFKYNLMDQGLEKLKSAARADDDFTSLLLGIRLVSMGETEQGLARFRKYNDGTLPTRVVGDGTLPEKEGKTLTIQLDFLEDVGLDAEAERLLLQATTAYPEEGRLLLRLAAVQLRLDKPEEAMALLPRTLGGWPQGETWERLAGTLQLLRRAGRLKDGLVLLDEACRETPRKGCRPALVFGYALQGDERALADQIEEATANGHSPQELFFLGQLLLGVGRTEAAEQLLNATLSAGWGSPRLLVQAHHQLARAYSASGRRDRIRDLNRLVLLETASDMQLRQTLPETLVENEYVDVALEQLSLLQLLSDQFPAPQLATFDVLVREGRLDEARELAYGTSYMSENLLNGLLTFATAARRRLAFELAHDLYSSAAEIDGTNQALVFATAELATVLGRLDEARQLYVKYVQGGPGESGRLREVTQNLCKYNQLAAARRMLGELPSPDARLDLGLHHLRAGLVDPGKALLTQALQAGGTEARQRALKTLAFGLTRPALLPEELRRLALDQACPPGEGPTLCRFHRGLSALAAGDKDEAVRIFDGQLAGNNDTWQYTLAAFRALIRTGHGEDAEQLLSRRMIGYNREQVLNEAMKVLFALLEEETLSAVALDEAVAVGNRIVAQLLAHKPYDFWYRTQRAELQLLAGQTDKALEMYEGYLRETPWEPGLHNNLAYLLSKLDKDLERGLDLVRKAMAWEPSHSAFYLDTEGWLLFRMGDLAAAESGIARAIARSHLGFGDALAESLFHLGVVREARGDSDGARQAFHTASFLDPFGEYGRLAREKLLALGVDPFHAE